MDKKVKELYSRAGVPPSPVQVSTSLYRYIRVVASDYVDCATKRVCRFLRPCTALIVRFFKRSPYSQSMLDRIQFFQGLCSRVGVPLSPIQVLSAPLCRFLYSLPAKYAGRATRVCRFLRSDTALHSMVKNRRPYCFSIWIEYNPFTAQKYMFNF